MNILILGGGKTGKFGNDFAERARTEGHQVFIFSHKKNEKNDNDQYVIDYDNLDNTKKVFEEVLQKIDTVDIILLNQNGRSYPYFDQHDIENVEIQLYINSLHFHVTISHLLISCAYKKLQDNSKIIFMSTGLAFQYNRNDYHAHYGYGGFKSLMTHIMLGLAHSRKKKIIHTILSPHFTYNDLPNYKKVFNNCYDWVFAHDDSCNAKIFGAWNPDSAPIELKLLIQEVLK